MSYSNYTGNASSNGGYGGGYGGASASYGASYSAGPTSYAGPSASVGASTYAAGPSMPGAGSNYDADVAAQQSIYTPGAASNPALMSQVQKGKGRTTVIRKAGGETWEDQTLLEWDPAHFRLFVGDLAPEVSDDGLAAFFSRDFPSFVKARVIRDKTTTKSKGFGFVAYADPEDALKAWKTLNGKYVGSRPIKISKATTQVGAVKIGDKKARQLEQKNKKPIQGVERLRTGAGAVWKNDNRPYARR